MRRLFRIVEWTIYIFGTGRRRAWCELTGGHQTELLGCWIGGDRASHVKVYCKRCDRETGWLHVPTKSRSFATKLGEDSIRMREAATAQRTPAVMEE